MLNYGFYMPIYGSRNCVIFRGKSYFRHFNGIFLIVLGKMGFLNFYDFLSND